MHKSLEIPGACLSLLPWCLRVSCLGQYCSAHWPRETLKILSMGGRGSIAMAGLGKQEVALNMIYAEKSPSWEGNKCLLLEQEASELECKFYWFQLKSKFCESSSKAPCCRYYFFFNKYFLTYYSLTSSSSQQTPLSEAIKQQPHFLFQYSVTLKYLIKERINMDACSPALLFLGEEAISS